MKSEHPGFFGVLFYSPFRRPSSSFEATFGYGGYGLAGSFKVIRAIAENTPPTIAVTMKLPRHPNLLIRVIDIEEIAVPT
jgi:hypothetical protein